MIWVVDARTPVAGAAAALLMVVLVAGCGLGARVVSQADPNVATAKNTRTRPPVKLTVEVNGDILVHSPVGQRASQDGHGNYDFAPMLREIRPYVKGADRAICDIETPMSPRPPHGYPVFNTPTQLARAIKSTGWRICDTASNHSVDQGQYGIDQTGLALDPGALAAFWSRWRSATNSRTCTRATPSASSSS
jgi:poly-gamma-glutamate capsule biosynthesis protein CapA/YwtB (metallophosphatase superfamily)